MLLFRQHVVLLLMVGAWRAVRTDAPACSALPTAGAPAEVVPAYAQSLACVIFASLPCPPTSYHVALFIACCRATTWAGVLASLVLLAVVGRDLRSQRAAQPVNPGLDLRSRVAILMREHRTQIGQQVEHDPHGPGEGHPLSAAAVM